MKNKPTISSHRKGFKEILTSFMLFLIVLSTLLLFISPVLAQTAATSVVEGLDVKLPTFETGHSDASYEPGADRITSAVLFAADLLMYLTGGIAVLVIISSGVRLITAGKNIEEVAPKQKEAIKYAVIGLIVIILVDTMIQQVFFGESGEVFRSQADVQLAAERGTEQIRGLYNFMEMFVGALAVLMKVYAGVRLVTSGGNEEVNTKMKKVITWSIAGIVLIGISELIVKDIVFPQQGTQLPDVVRAQQLIVNITNFISGFIATVAVAMFMYGGFLYVTAVGKEEQTGKAKKVLFGAAIGLIIAMAAFAIVNTFIKLDPELGEATETFSESVSDAIPSP